TLYPSYVSNYDMYYNNRYNEVMRKGIGHSHNLGISGGNSKTNYYFSTGYTSQEGIIQKNDFERINGRLNIDHKVSNAIKVGATMNYTNTINRAPNTGSLPGQSFGTA